MPRSTPSPSRHGAAIRRGHRATRRSCSSGSEATPTATALWARWPPPPTSTPSPPSAASWPPWCEYRTHPAHAHRNGDGARRSTSTPTTTGGTTFGLHVPVETTPDVAFQAGDETVHMAAGEAWVFDTWQRHRVDNPAASPRIHLVVDTVGSARACGTSSSVPRTGPTYRRPMTAPLRRSPSSSGTGRP